MLGLEICSAKAERTVLEPKFVMSLSRRLSENWTELRLVLVLSIVTFYHPNKQSLFHSNQIRNPSAKEDRYPREIVSNG